MESLLVEGPGLDFSLSNLSLDPTLKNSIEELELLCWPRWMLEGGASALQWEELAALWPQFQVCVLSSDGRLAATARCVPIYWLGTLLSLPSGADEALHMGLSSGVPPNTLVPFQVAVHPEFRGADLGTFVLQAARKLARGMYMAMLIPVRPTKKHLYPNIPMADYALWHTPDGRIFDPWIRAHVDFGAKIVGIAPNSRNIKAKLAKWEDWTNMKFAQSGNFLIPSALAPLEIDIEKKIGNYHEPNVWLLHLGPGGASIKKG